MDHGLPTVLVIDDDADHRRRLIDILATNGFPCAASSRDAGALDLARRVKPAVVLARRRASESAPSPLVEEVARLVPGVRVVHFVSIGDAVPMV